VAKIIFAARLSITSFLRNFFHKKRPGAGVFFRRHPAFFKLKNLKKIMVSNYEVEFYHNYDV